MLYREDLKWVNDCDVIFSIGGDIYTLPPGFKNSNFKPYYSNMIHFGNLFMKKEIRFELGASIWPFEDSFNAKNAFSNHDKKVDLITFREPKTSSYLRFLGIQENVIICKYPAFAISKIKNTNYKSNKRIGINLSPHSSYHDMEFG